MLELTETHLTLPQLPAELDGLRILHVSDLHTRGFGRQERALKRVLAQGCDLLAITGDSCWQMRFGNPFVDTRNAEDYHRIGLHREGLVFPPRTETALAVWSRLLEGVTCPLGIYGIQGNHDTAEFITGLADMGVHILANESRLLEPPTGGTLRVAGVASFGRSTWDIPATLADVEPEDFCLVLTHFPETVEALAAAGVDLVLAGHTHGGQICLPGGRALLTHSYTGTRYVAGLRRIERTWLYTSRGVGASLLPLRVNCPAEVVRLHLHRGSPETVRTTVHRF